MRFFGLYLKSHYASHLRPEIKRLLVSSAIVAAVFVIVSMWPAFEASHRSTYAHARYDIMVNGPLLSADLADIDRVLGSSERVAVHMDVGGADQIRAVGTNRVTKGMVYRYESTERSKLGYTYFNRGVLLAGKMGSADAWGIDAVSARKLGVGVGDLVRFVQIFTLPGESRVRVARTGTIAAIYQPSTVLSGIVVPFEPEDRPILKAIGPAYTHVFYVVGPNAEGPANRLRALPQASNWMVDTLARHREQAEIAIAMGTGDTKSLTTGILLVGAITYGAFALFDERARFRRRRRGLAIATSLGCSPTSQFAALAAEQITFVVVSVGLGLWIGSLLSWVMLRAYIPDSVYAVAALWGCAANIAVIASTTGVTVLRMRRLPIAHVLTSE